GLGPPVDGRHDQAVRISDQVALVSEGLGQGLAEVAGLLHGRASSQASSSACSPSWVSTAIWRATSQRRISAAAAAKRSLRTGVGICAGSAGIWQASRAVSGISRRGGVTVAGADGRAKIAQLLDDKAQISTVARIRVRLMVLGLELEGVAVDDGGGCGAIGGRALDHARGVAGAVDLGRARR